MGVPAFFRWLTRKYPKLLADVVEGPHMLDETGSFVEADASQPNPNGREFDNLYLDMNGIIHPCVHPEEGPVPETEDDMMKAIFVYIDRIFAMVRPRKVLYLAIDGVAPRSKQAQQRKRRFMSIKEAEVAAASKAKAEQAMARLNHKKGLPATAKVEKARFDHNCITPGTKFMDKVARSLRYYVAERLSTRPGWQGVKVILSDASVPGEGEHKIMDFIRVQRQQEGYDPNTSHVIYGLDADLIMLGLATHELHFSILREEVLFGREAAKCHRCGQKGHFSGECRADMPKAHPGGGPNPNPSPADSAATKSGADTLQVARKPFHFLHLWRLRQYLARDLTPNNIASMPFAFDFERAIDDWVFLCFFVGNDFLPHLPTLSIREGALDLLMALYVARLPSYGGYLTLNGSIQFTRVGKLLEEVGKFEDRILRNRVFQKNRRKDRSRQDKQRRRDDRMRRAQQQQREAALANARLQAAASTATVQPVTTLTSAAAAAAGDGGGSGATPASVTPTSHNKAAAAALRSILGGTGGGGGGGGGGEEAKASAKMVVEGDVEKEGDDSVGDGQKESGQEGAQQYDDAMVEEDNDAAADADADDDDAEEDEEDDATAELRRTRRRFRTSELGAAEIGKAPRPARDVETDLSASSEEPTDTIRLGEDGWKQRYYEAKFGERAKSDAFLAQLARDYVLGLHWVLQYYYQGCQSWSWYYPYHYAPFASDLAQYVMWDDYEPVLELGEPFAPLWQLMSVLPPASSWCLPPSWARLMTDPTSELADVYPTDFDLDMDGKRYMWQGVALLPFIDEEHLTSVLKPMESELTEEERVRNSTKSDVVLVHKDHALATPMASVRSVGGDVPGTLGLAGHFAPLNGQGQPVVPGQPFPSPVQGCPDVPNVRAVATLFRQPNVPPGEFVSACLPNVTPPTPDLRPEDVVERRTFHHGAASRLIQELHGRHHRGRGPNRGGSHGRRWSGGNRGHHGNWSGGQAAHARPLPRGASYGHNQGMPAHRHMTHGNARYVPYGQGAPPVSTPTPYAAYGAGSAYGMPAPPQPYAAAPGAPVPYGLPPPQQGHGYHQPTPYGAVGHTAGVPPGPYPMPPRGPDGQRSHMKQQRRG